MEGLLKPGKVLELGYSPKQDPLELPQEYILQVVAYYQEQTG